METTLAERLARYACSLRANELPAPVSHEVKRRLIDSLATAAGAMMSPAHVAARRCASRVQGTPAASLLGGGESSPEWACFVNGLLIRYLDFNDTYLSKEPAHPSDNWAAVLAAAEIAQASGSEIIKAITLAYEVQCRFCDAASLRQHGVDHVTYGALSSALASGYLLQLDETQLRHAVGIAGVCNVALRQTRSGELSMWKGAAFANAARNGLFAALLAREGMTGPAPLFEGDLGFFNLVSKTPFEPAPMGGEPGNSDGFMINKTYIKFWPAEYHSQSAIDAALQLREKLGHDVSQVAAIDIDTFEASYNIIGKYPEAWAPRTRETADHSLPYCTAAALYDGFVNLDTFSEQFFREEKRLAFTSKVKVHLDHALTPRYPKGIPNRLRVTMTNGTHHEMLVEFPRGHAENPMTDQEVEAKFRDLMGQKIPNHEEILARCWNLEKLNNVSELLRLVYLEESTRL